MEHDQSHTQADDPACGEDAPIREPTRGDGVSENAPGPGSDPTLTVSSGETPHRVAPPAGGWRFDFSRWDAIRALRHRDYRLFFIGAFLSNIGGWLANVAEGYLVYEMTGSTAILGLLGFVGTIPVLIFGPLAGVTADRFHRRKILLTTQSMLLVDYAIIAALLFANRLEIWHLLTLATISGVAMAFNSPAYQSLTVEFVGPEDLQNAIALNSMQFNLGRILGGLLGGFMYVLLGKAWCFALDSLSFLAVIAALLMVQIRPPYRTALASHAFGNFVEGIRHLARNSNLLAIVVMAASVTLFSQPFFTMLPVYAKDILHGDARMQSLLLTAVGVGALMAAFLQASSRDESHMGLQMLTAMGTLSLCLVIFARSDILPVSLVALSGLGASTVGFMTSANTAMQLLIPDEMRGRLMSVFVMVSFGLMPIGSLMVGYVAKWTSAPTALTLGALITGVAGVVAFTRYPHIRGF